VQIPGSEITQTAFLKKADADNLDAAKATLKGLKTRYQETGIPPIFIHTVCNPICLLAIQSTTC
jgi:hypothetical protein